MKERPFARVLATLLLAAGALPGATARAQGLDPEREIAPFAEEVAREHGLDAARVRALLGEARVLDGVLAAISRPAEAKPWREYRPIFLNGRRFLGDGSQDSLFDAIEQAIADAKTDTTTDTN